MLVSILILGKYETGKCTWIDNALNCSFAMQAQVALRVVLMFDFLSCISAIIFHTKCELMTSSCIGHSCGMHLLEQIQRSAYGHIGLMQLFVRIVQFNWSLLQKGLNPILYASY